MIHTLLRIFLAAFLIEYSFFASAQENEEAPLPPITTPVIIGSGDFMGNSCKSHCVWTQIYGTIDESAAKRYRKYRLRFGCESIEIHATGRNIIAAINLGKEIHRCRQEIGIYKPTGFITPFYDNVPAFGDGEVGQCFGACLYAFIGGGMRKIWEGSKFTMESLDAMDEKKWRKLTDYVHEMGVSDSLVEAQREVQKSGKPRTLTDQELKDWKIINKE